MSKLRAVEDSNAEDESDNIAAEEMDGQPHQGITGGRSIDDDDADEHDDYEGLF